MYLYNQRKKCHSKTCSWSSPQGALYTIVRYFRSTAMQGSFFRFSLRTQRSQQCQITPHKITQESPTWKWNKYPNKRLCLRYDPLFLQLRLQCLLIPTLAGASVTVKGKIHCLMRKAGGCTAEEIHWNALHSRALHCHQLYCHVFSVRMLYDKS